MNDYNLHARAVIGEGFKELRKERGLSIEDLAQLSELDTDTIIAVEQGIVDDFDIILHYMRHVKIHVEFSLMDANNNIMAKWGGNPPSEN